MGLVLRCSSDILKPSSTSNETLDTLFKTLPQKGKVTWIGVRPERRAEMVIVDAVEAKTQSGLTGDRYAGRSGKHQVTLIQTEHLPVIASNLGLESFDPAEPTNLTFYFFRMSHILRFHQLN